MALENNLNEERVIISTTSQESDAKFVNEIPHDIAAGTFFFGWSIDSGEIRKTGGGEIHKIYKAQTHKLAQYEALACALWSLNNSMGLSSEVTIKCDNWDVVMHMTEHGSTPMECRDVCRATVDTCTSIIPSLKWRMIAKEKNRPPMKGLIAFINGNYPC